MKGPGGHKALRGSADLRSAQGADVHRRTAVTITEMVNVVRMLAAQSIDPAGRQAVRP